MEIVQKNIFLRNMVSLFATCSSCKQPIDKKNIFVQAYFDELVFVKTRCFNHAKIIDTKIILNRILTPDKDFSKVTINDYLDFKNQINITHDARIN